LIYTDTRDAIFDELYSVALNDKNVIVLTADTGIRKFEDFKRNIPDRFCNVGVSEQNMISVAAGLALEGKHVFVFGISNFVTLRCFEQIKLDICAMNLPVTILGLGTGYNFSHDGPTHHITDDIAIMRMLPNMTIWSPSDYAMTAQIIHMAHELKSPSYIRFDKGPFHHVYDGFSKNYFDNGICKIGTFEDLAIVATGITVTQALDIQKELVAAEYYISAVDFFRLKPINKSIFKDSLAGMKKIVVLEEHCRDGGLGSIVLEQLNDCGLNIPVRRIGIADCFRPHPGSRDYLRELSGLDTKSVIENIKGWLRSGV
jgi:transketolase